MKNINFLILATFLITGSIYAQGYVEDSFEEISQLDNYSKEGFGFADDIPVRKTLEKYVPAIGNQRKTGSCVAWATTYYNLQLFTIECLELLHLEISIRIHLIPGLPIHK